MLGVRLPWKQSLLPLPHGDLLWKTPPDPPLETHTQEGVLQPRCVSHSIYGYASHLVPRGRLKASLLFCLSVGIEVPTVTTSPFLFPESELVTEPEEEEEKDTKEAEKEEGQVNCPSLADSKLYVSDKWLPVLKVRHKIKKALKSFGPDSVVSAALAETDLEEMAMHETEDNKVFQRFKKKIAPEPHQVQTNYLMGQKASVHNVSVHLIVFLCSGAALHTRGLSCVGLFSARPFRSGHPTMHLWCQEDL